ncbi:MAG: outer membrane protein assembly factor BamA [Gammaproteobacteria bacterium]|nr:outer membrane protein assembly factor BamA [Gammaproteobacteria bacterium]
MKGFMRKYFVMLVFLTFSGNTLGFIVEDIRLQGLQRVSAGTVFNILPISVGDSVDELSTRQLIRLLFGSGFFDDIRMARDGDVLVITFDERPAIDSIEIEGNKAIKTDALLDGLGQQGLREGEIFKQATLERVGIELERQYVTQGRYGASIETTIDELARNRVAIKIDVEEGKSSGIRHINIVGASVFPIPKLLDQFELKHPSLLSFYRNDDKYAREKLTSDLEALEAYYRDRGYVEFDISSTQVSITPDKRQVYIAINIDEGDKYTVEKVSLVGDLNDVSPADLERLFLVAKGEVFSQAKVTATEELLTRALGNSGYTFSTASGVPYVHEDGTVDVEFFVESGKRAYVRRISFTGNKITQDDVLRREMRQMEGGWASTAQIDLSKLRLERLGYFETVDVETPEVPGTDDQIDVEFVVKEQPSGSISASIGFSQGYGLMLGANYQESNVLGTGNSLGLGVNYSDWQQSVQFNYFDPYYTMDGISRGYNLFARRLDFDERNIARFTTDSFGGGITFGFPIGETQRINFGGTIEYTDITEGLYPAKEIREFIEDNGSKSLNYKLNLAWKSVTLNRGLFPTAGRSQSLALEVSIPGSDLQFYKLIYSGQQYLTFFDRFTFKLRGELGYANGYGGKELPFFEHFFSGGFGSVRGFEISSLGPRTTPDDDDPWDEPEGDPFGGNMLVEGSIELIMPFAWARDSRQFRPVLFFDVGNVYNTDCPRVSVNCLDFDLGELRYAVGLGITWLTGMGPMTFSIAKTFNTSDIDELEGFQFELGRTL